MKFAIFTTGVGVNVDKVTTFVKCESNTRLFFSSQTDYVDVPTSEWEKIIHAQNEQGKEIAQISKSIIELKELLRARLH